MRVDVYTSDRIEIALSERNLVAMLSKVRRAGSARQMEKLGDGEEPYLIIRCEPDADHYGSRPYPPGPVHPLDREVEI